MMDPEFLLKAQERIKFYREYPEIAAEDLLRVELAPHQKVILRSMWFQDYVICIMCRGSGKTFLQAVFASLKAMLYPGHRVGLLAPTFRQAKMMFEEVKALYQRSPIFQDACERRPVAAADNCFVPFKSVGLKKASTIQALPLGDGTKIRGARFYTILCDEFPHIPEEIFNMVIRPMGATVNDPMENVRKVKRQKELLGKGLITQEEVDEDTSANQIIITSSGYFTFNHMYDLYCAYKKEMQEGSKKHAVFRVPYPLLPDGFLDKANIDNARKQMSSLEFRIEYEAAFIPDTDDFYKASLLESCSNTNFSTQVAGSFEKTYCLGIDPARTEDSFAIVVVEMGVPAKIVHAIELQKQPFPKMAALIEDLCEDFNVHHIYMDSQGGGHAIKDILAENSRSLSAGAILDPEDEVHQLRSGRHILNMCHPSTDFISDSNFHALRLLEHRDLLFPSVPRDDTPSYAEEESWSTIYTMKQQLQMIELRETPTGKHHFDVPHGEGHSTQKKDLYSAFMHAAACVYDNLWLEQMPDDIMHHGGLLKPRDEPPDGPMAGIPEAIRDKIEMVQDPEGFRQRMMTGSFRNRTVLTSPAAVLKPVPKKPKPKHR